MTSIEQTQQRQHFDIVIGSLVLVSYVARWLGSIAKLDFRQIPTQVRMLHEGHPDLTIENTNCGFFTTPVIQMGILDIRRSLEFMGLTCSSQRQRVEGCTNRRPDDLGIEDFGLSKVSPADFLRLADQIAGRSAEADIMEVHHWSHKKLAHFTKHFVEVRFGPICLACDALIASYVKFFYAPLGYDVPDLGPSKKIVDAVV